MTALIRFLLIYVAVLYGFSILTQAWSIRASEFPTLMSVLSFVVQIPVVVWLNTSPATFCLFILNVSLVSIYIFLLARIIARAKHERLAYGLSGSFFAVLSIGCTACGALLTPLLILSSIGIPASALVVFDRAIGVGATVLLLLGILSLRRHLGVTMKKAR